MSSTLIRHASEATTTTNSKVTCEPEGMQWKFKRGGEAVGDVRLSDGGLTLTATFASEPGVPVALNWAVQGTRTIPRELTGPNLGPSDPACWYYEIEIGVVEGSDNYHGDMSVGFVIPTEEGRPERHRSWTQITYDNDGFCRDAVGALHDTCMLKYGPTFAAGDVVGCGVDLATDRVFFTKNGFFLGMTQNIIPKDTPLTPFVIGMLNRRVTRTLIANFGHRPFKSLSVSVLQSIADAQTDFDDNPEKLPRKWSRYPAVPLAFFEENDSIVTLKGLALDATESSTIGYYSGGRVVRSNLPVPPLCNFFYFEVELISIPIGGAVHIGFIAGDEELTTALGCTRFAGSWGYSSIDGSLYQGNKKVTYGRPLNSGDVIGCGLDRVTCRSFFTINGASEGVAPLHIGKPSEIPHGIYPSAWLSSAGGSLRINCGTHPFAYDLESHMKVVHLTRERSAVLGSQLPEEIIDQIIQLVPDERDEQVWCMPWTVSRVKLEKRFLGLCSLTCRHWAHRCRSIMFEGVRITTSHDATFSLQLVRSPRFSIAPHVRLLHLEEWSGGATRPWVLQTLAMLGSRLPRLTALVYIGRHRLSIAPPTLAEHDRRAEHPMLSGRLSPLVRSFKELRQLFLVQLHFRDFAEISRTVRGIGRLEIMALHEVSWDSETVLPSPRRSIRGPTKTRIHLCTKAGAPLCFLGNAWNVQASSDVHDLPSVPHVAHANVQALRRMVECMAPETLDVKVLYPSGSDVQPGTSEQPNGDASSCVPRRLEMTFHYPRGIEWAASVEVNSEDFGGMRRLSRIAFVTPELEAHVLDIVPLEEVDVALAALDDIEVVFTIPSAPEPTKGNDDWKELRMKLEGDIQRRMVGLYDQGRISVNFSEGSGVNDNTYNTFFNSD